MASPSRSGSVARKMSVASFAASFSSLSTFLRLGDDLVGRLEVLVDVDAQLALGQIADVAHRGDDLVVAPRYLLMVFAFAGDSTTTSDFAILALFPP